MVGRIKLGPISPIASGDIELMKVNPTEATEAAVEKFVDEHPSPKIDRYLDLLDALKTATPKGFNTQGALKLGPMSLFAGAERDLAEQCVGRR